MEKEQEGESATLIFKKYHLVSPVVVFLSVGLAFHPPLSLRSKNSHEHRVLAEFPGMGFFFKFHTSFTPCCSGYTIQPRAQREER
jgi:hypothetical protein